MLLNARHRGVVGEFLGTSMLVMAVVGSGIAAQRLTPEPGLRLLINAFATAGALVALIITFASISDARFNPVVTLLAFAARRVTLPEAAVEIVAQVAGAVVGVAVANTMFGVDSFQVAATDRSAGRLMFSEVIATLGLLLVIELTARSHGVQIVAMTVAGYIAGAYFFTSSTSFANPAVTIARTLTDTYTGIKPSSTIRFIPAQLLGAVLAVGLTQLFREPKVAATAGVQSPPSG